jgi:hypothetical protein
VPVAQVWIHQVLLQTAQIQFLVQLHQQVVEWVVQEVKLIQENQQMLEEMAAQEAVQAVTVQTH